LKYRELLARPLMLAAMVLVACMLFVRFFQGWDRIYGFRGVVAGSCFMWRPSGQRSQRSRFPQRLRGGVVAWHRRLHVWRVCCFNKRMVDGFRPRLPLEFTFGRKRTGRIALRSQSRRLRPGRNYCVRPAVAQSPPLLNPRGPAQDKLVIDADQLVYDKDKIRSRPLARSGSFIKAGCSSRPRPTTASARLYRKATPR
jgi:hypothetical protein